jgi:hypothetical protein
LCIQRPKEQQETAMLAKARRAKVQVLNDDHIEMGEPLWRALRVALDNPCTETILHAMRAAAQAQRRKDLARGREIKHKFPQGNAPWTTITARNFPLVIPDPTRESITSPKK